MKEQLLKAWQINNDMNLLLINNISDEAMQKTLNPRGRNIYEQLAHLHNIRVNWLEASARDISKSCTTFKKEGIDRRALTQAFHDSTNCFADLISRSWDNAGKVKNFKTGIIPMVSYLISHESHHRGNIMLTLKQSGEIIPDAVKWGLWEWGK